MTAKEVRNGILLYMPQLYNIIDGTWTRDYPNYSKTDDISACEKKIYNEYMYLCKKTFDIMKVDQSKYLKDDQSKLIIFTTKFDKSKINDFRIICNEDYEYVVLSEKNLDEYVIISDNVLYDFKHHKISKKHFEEYVACRMLARHNCIYISSSQTNKIINVNKILDADIGVHSNKSKQNRFFKSYSLSAITGKDKIIFSETASMLERYFNLYAFPVTSNLTQMILDYILSRKTIKYSIKDTKKGEIL